MSASPATLDRAALRAFLVSILESNLEATLAQARPDGRMGTDPWINRDQHDILPLTLLYLTDGSSIYRDPKILTIIAKGGSYLARMLDEKGMWRFDKKDGSYWGQIYTPWTYLRWIMTYQLIKDELPADELKFWQDGLLLGFSGIAETELNSRSNIYPGPLPGHPPLKPGEVIPWVHNIPSHHATGLFLAGQLFARPAWQQQARDFMQLVVAAQSPEGWWTEHVGPVVLYNRVYIEALGLYYALSGDRSVLPAIERGNRFHLNYVYPNGAMIETVDERNPYAPLTLKSAPNGTTLYLPKQVNIHPGLFYSDSGRALLAHQLPIVRTRDPNEIIDVDYLYYCLNTIEEELTFSASQDSRFRMGDDALIAREAPWVVSLSAYCAPRWPGRFIQDRQNLASIYHRDAGLILGGGNTKIQPLWSTMTVGDPSLLSPIGAKRETNLAPEVDVAYTPDACVLAESSPRSWKQTITTAGATAELAIAINDDTAITLSARLVTPAPDGRAVAAHLTFIPYLKSPLTFSDGSTVELDATAWEKSGLSKIGHHGWNLSLPVTAKVTWPVLPHNPYTDDGHADLDEGRLVVTLPLDHEELTLTLTVLP
ncbi:MAG: hypothetical protein K9M98_14060 [Cephaloticoccus sp.]|nr:hypothetical protein [Cephaloticoccus sp.]MCF7761620.1 hypothetical protein [Cephaloticoccus sp.]